MAEWFNTFLKGYEHVQILNDEDNSSYKDIEENFAAILQFKELEKQTRELIEDIKKNISNKDKFVAKAKKYGYGKKMKKFSDVFYKDFAIVAIDPNKVKVKISMVEERVGRFRSHGGYALVIGVILLGIVAWQIRIHLKDYAHMDMGVAGGFTVGVLIFSLIYFRYLAKLKKNLARWKKLQTDMSKEEDIKADIAKKKPITRKLTNLLLDVNTDDDDIVFLLENIVTQCDKYLRECDDNVCLSGRG